MAILNCTICGIRVEKSKYVAHLNSNPHLLLAQELEAQSPHKNPDALPSTISRKQPLGIPHQLWSWKCTTCEKPMKPMYRESHLTSKSHALRLAGANRPPGLVSPDSAHIESRWVCKTCKSEMSILDKEAHLSGKRHAAEIIAGEALPQIEKWKCDICDQKMPKVCRGSHIRSKAHTEKRKAREWRMQGLEEYLERLEIARNADIQWRMIPGRSS